MPSSTSLRNKIFYGTLLHRASANHHLLTYSYLSFGASSFDMLSFRIFIPYILGFDVPDFRYFSLKWPFFSGGILQHRFIPSFDYFWVILGYYLFHFFLVIGFVFYFSVFVFQSRIDLYCIIISLGQELSNINRVSYSRCECNGAAVSTHFDILNSLLLQHPFPFFLVSTQQVL